MEKAKTVYSIVDMLTGIPYEVGEFDNVEEAMEFLDHNYTNRNKGDGMDDHFRRLNTGVMKTTYEIIHVNKH
jgi:hypothetical protein